MKTSIKEKNKLKKKINLPSLKLFFTFFEYKHPQQND